MTGEAPGHVSPARHGRVKQAAWLLPATLPAPLLTRYADDVTTDNGTELPAYAHTDRELLEAIYVRLSVLEGEMNRLLTAWSAGGLRGLRAAAKNGSGGLPDGRG